MKHSNRHRERSEAIHSPLPHDPATLTPHHHTVSAADKVWRACSVLAWPAWLRVAAVLPLVLLLWLAVWWANEETSLW